MDFPDEANDILQNGILVETSKGVVCMSVNDALSSNLNLSVEDLQLLATQLLLQNKDATAICDSDGFTSESSETCGQQTKVIFTSISPKSSTIVSPNEANIISILPISKMNAKVPILDSSNVSDSDVSSNTKTSDSMDELLKTTVVTNKKRGGWPKGRKRKPELLHLPPKAPATGYNLYLNDQRKLYKDSSLAFHEITKLIGNRWSSLSLEDKKPYLDKAEEEKKRYREELRVYRQSGAYQLYLANKRRKRAKYNVMSESDMDATDDFDEEDNEELYCRTCDQWFHNLHNKREHLQGRQHIQSVAGAIKRELDLDRADSALGGTSALSLSTSLDESSLDGTSLSRKLLPIVSGLGHNVSDAMKFLMETVCARNSEIKLLESNLDEIKCNNEALYRQLCSLRERENKLKNDLEMEKKREREMEMKVFNLWQVPNWFIITNLDASGAEVADEKNDT